MGWLRVHGGAIDACMRRECSLCGWRRKTREQDRWESHGTCVRVCLSQKPRQGRRTPPGRRPVVVMSRNSVQNAYTLDKREVLSCPRACDACPGSEAQHTPGKNDTPALGASFGLASVCVVQFCPGTKPTPETVHTTNNTAVQAHLRALRHLLSPLT